MEERRGGPPRPAVSGVERIPARAVPQLLDYWGLPNLQAINRDVHAAKCAAEARDRYAARHLPPELA